MRRSVGVAAGALAVTIAATGCAPHVTEARVEDAIGPAFASLYARQQQLLGKPLAVAPQASASCRRNDSAVASSGAGDDWVCRLLLQVGGPAAAYTYEVNVKADGCYSADGPPGLVGGRTLAVPGGAARVNPLFAFDGCFDT